MTHYKVTEVKSSSLIVEFKDKSWAEVPVNDDMTEVEIDAAVYEFAPKPPVESDVIKTLVGQDRIAQPMTQKEPDSEMSDSSLDETPEQAFAGMSQDEDLLKQQEEEFKQELVERVLNELSSK